MGRESHMYAKLSHESYEPASDITPLHDNKGVLRGQLPNSSSADLIPSVRKAGCSASISTESCCSGGQGKTAKLNGDAVMW